jgi:hypothetical protein
MSEITSARSKFRNNADLKGRHRVAEAGFAEAAVVI